MKQKQKMQLIPLTQLNLTNRFLFDEVMEDPKTQSLLPVSDGHISPGTRNYQL